MAEPVTRVTEAPDGRPPTVSIPQSLGESLRAAVGSAHVLTDPDLIAGYDRDWTGRFLGRAAAVVRPSSAAETSAVIAACAAHRWAVVPQGGNTGLVGGSVALDGEIVVSTRRMRTIGPIDELTGQVTVGAGVTLEDLQHAAGPLGWRVHVDLGARSAATIGGMVATNAGGTHVLRFGSMRAGVRGVELVTGTGAVVAHLGGLAKDNTGYDLAPLVTGSEGTLGVITAVRMQLVRTAATPLVVGVGLHDLTAALRLLRAIQSSGVVLEAAEFVLARGASLVAEQLGVAIPAPFSQPVGILFEIDADASGGLDATVEAMSALLSRDAPDAVVSVALDPGARAALWAVRERHTEAINRLGPPVKLDVTIPLGQLASFCAQMIAEVEDVVLFGHLGDGNVHVNVPGKGGDPMAAATVESFVLGRVAALGGSISAEHGIGTAKRAFLHLARTPAEIELFRSLKSAFDPSGICNPGVLLPAGPAPYDQAP